MNASDCELQASTLSNTLEALAESVGKLPRGERPSIAKEFTSDLKALMKQGKKDGTIHGVKKYLNYLFDNLPELQNAEVRREIHRGIIIENLEIAMRCFSVKNK